MTAETPQHTVLDIDTQRIAAVYAKAFLGAAETAGKTDALVAELRSLIVNVIDKFPEFTKVLGSSFVSHDEKAALLDRVLGKQATPEMLSFVKVVSAHGRLNILKAVEQEVEHRYNVLRGRVEVEVRTAAPLTKQLLEEITLNLRQMLEAEPKLNVITDPLLLGGIVVRVGDTVYDGSIAFRLRQLTSRITDRTIQEIETRRDRFLGNGAI